MGPGRFRIVGALAPQGGWTVEVALDRDRTPPRPVELAQVPLEVMSDGVTLAAMLRASELATRVVHPAVQPVLGLVEHGGGMALASAHLEGTTLPALLAAGGPLPAELAVRVAGQVARALEAVHGLTTAGQRPLVHGAVIPELVRVRPDGAVLLAGLGRPAAGSPADDLAALRRLLAALNPDLPPELEVALDSLAGPEATAAGTWRAIEAAVAPAEPAQLALWMERMAPEAAAERQAGRRALSLALEDEVGEPVDEALQAAQAGPAPAPSPPPLHRAAPREGAPSLFDAAPAAAPGSAPARAPAAAARRPEAPVPAARAGGEAEPDWFAPPTPGDAAPPPRAPAAAPGPATPPPASRSTAGPRTPPLPLPLARATEAAAPTVGSAWPPRPLAAVAPHHPAPAGWPDVERWRLTVIAAAALLGLAIGFLTGR